MSDRVKYQIILGFAAIYIIWGSTYLAIKLGVETIPPFLMAGVRFVIGGLIFYSWGRIKKKERLRPSHWRATFIVGALLLAGGNGLVSWAEEVVPSGITALIIATVPMWIVLFDWFRPGGNRPRFIVGTGILLGFIGVAILINPTNIGGIAEINLFGAMLLILASILWAAGSVYSKYAEMPKSHITSAGMQMLTGGMLLLVLSLIAGEIDQLQIVQISAVSTWSLVYLISFGSLGYGAYIWLLKVTDASKVATYAFVNPVIALLLGKVIASEPITLWTLGCSILIIAAVVIIITAKAKKDKNMYVIENVSDKPICLDSSK